MIVPDSPTGESGVPSKEISLPAGNRRLANCQTIREL
jgi:hypothetical protein